jgi:hypothetical protein
VDRLRWDTVPTPLDHQPPPFIPPPAHHKTGVAEDAYSSALGVARSSRAVATAVCHAALAAWGEGSHSRPSMTG